ncbi:MAG: aspartate/glutamate racemase family protein [Pseudomonadota bacterium]
MKPVLLINPNGSAATTAMMVRIARPHVPAIVGWTNVQAPPMITEPQALAKAAAQLAVAELPEAAGVIVAAFGDPGVAELSARLDVPVVGIGATAAEAASRCGPFSVVTTTPRLQEPINRLMGARSGYLGCFFADGDPMALAADPAALDAALIKATGRAARAGSSSVIVGGGPLAEAAQRIQKAVPVPLIHPLREACARFTP